MKSLSIFFLPLIAGCLSSAPKAPTHWTIDYERASSKSVSVEAAAAGAVRVASVEVCAPYNGTRLAVLRPDGSIAFDAFNAFAASPAMLLKGAIFETVVASGRFSNVVTAGSSASARYTMEVYVTELALDCRIDRKRTVNIALMTLLLEGRQVVANVRGTAAEEAGSDYSAAFSTAVARAMQNALEKMPVK